MIHQHAQIAIHAAKHVEQWGFFASKRYVSKRKVPAWLFELACILEWEANCNSTGIYEYQKLYNSKR